MSGDVGAEVAALTPTWHRGMYGCPDDMYAARDLRTQLAPLIAERVRAAQAEALREAADALNTTDHATETALMGIDHVIDWLRDRAAALNPGPRP